MIGMKLMLKNQDVLRTLGSFSSHVQSWDAGIV